MNLFIDTHLNDVVIILSNNGRICKDKTIIGEKQNSRIIMPTIKKLLNNEKPKSIVVVNGPGSFTGVRLGVTIAKTLAYTLGIPIYTITALECMAISVDDSEKIVAFNDNNGYYIGIFNKRNKLIGNYEYLNNIEFNEFKKEHNILENIKLNYENIINFALTKKPINAHKVNPIYIKKIDVEK